MEQLAGYLKRIRIEAGYESQEKFASTFPQSHDWVQKREVGTVMITYDDFKLWCQKCNVSLDAAIKEIPESIDMLKRCSQKQKIKSRLKGLQYINVDEMTQEQLDYLEEICEKTSHYKRK